MMSISRSLTFNPDSLRFIASRYGFETMHELAEALELDPERLQAMADGEAVPTNNEVAILMVNTRMPIEWFAKAKGQLPAAA